MGPGFDFLSFFATVAGIMKGKDDEYEKKKKTHTKMFYYFWSVKGPLN